MRRKPTLYERSGYISLSRRGSGLLYPLFKTENINVSFVQEVGRNGEISTFIPFYDHDFFSFHPASGERHRVIGEASLYAFLNSANKLIELSYDEIGPLVRMADPLVTDESLPLLTRLSLLRVGQAPQASQLNMLADFLHSALPKASSRKIARAAHQRTAFEREKWWDRYLSEVGDNLPNTENEFRAFEIETLFSWLYDNTVDDRWTLGLRTLMVRIVYDQRLFDFLLKFLTFDEIRFANLSGRERAIIGRGLELYSALDSSENDFAEAMYDHVINGDIFYLSRTIPLETIFDFIDDLESNGKLETSPIDIYIDQLRSDYIDASSAYALLERIETSSMLRVPYPAKSYYKDRTRLSVLQDLVKQSGRLGLVLDAQSRRRIQKLSH